MKQATTFLIAAIVAFLLIHSPLPLGVSIFLILAMPYWMGPVAVKFKQRQSIRTDLRDARNETSVPDAIKKIWDGVIQSLAPIGFVEAGRFFQASASGRPHGFVLLLQEKSTGDVCSHIAIAFNNIAITHTSFSTHLRSGEVVGTSNSATIFPWPSKPQIHTIYLPQIRDPAALYQQHRKHAKLIPGIVEPPDVMRYPLIYQQKRETETREHWVNIGYFYLDETEGMGTYRPTWKGAFLMSWKLLPPWKQLARSRLKKRAQEFLQS